jgi:pyrroline-5-carboxylate reductase
MKLGVIGGGGWLGGAIVQSLLDAGLVTPEDLCLSSRSEKPGRFPQAFWTADSQALADRSDVIVLSVRPEDWPPLAVDARGKLVISVMAGIRLADIAMRHQTERVVRSLPNAAAEVGLSYTPWVASAGVGDEDRATVRAIFGACGVEDEVPGERDIDYFTGLTGSGPAFPALLAAAMMRDAVAHGISPDMARRAVNTLMSGAGRLVERHDSAPDRLVDAFVAYRGTTAAAIEAMRAAGFERAVAEGLAAAFRKSVDMGS